MTKKWAEVAASPEFQSLPPDAQEAARQQYWREVVQPQVPQEQREAVRGQFDADTKIQAPSQPAAEKPKERSFLESAARQVGLTARHGIAGVAAPFAMAADAVSGVVNTGLDAVAGEGNGPRFMPAGQALQRAMTAAGLPEPENAQERVVGDMTSAMAGAGGMVKAGQVLSNAAGPIASKVGSMLAEGAKTQVISAGTGAGASGLTREAGGGAVAQTVAGIAGALAPVARPLMRPTGGSKQLLASAQKAHEAGYVVPPADLNPGIADELMSGISGKIKTAQEASARNQAVTNSLAKRALGLSDDIDLNADLLASIRKNAASAYQGVSGAGTVTASGGYAAAIDDAVAPYLSQAKSFPQRKMPSVVDDILSLKTEQFDAGDAVNTIRVLRNEADSAYRAGDKLAGGALKKAAGALEDEIERHLGEMGEPAANVLRGYRDARQLIAQTYTVEKALNSQTGNVSAQVIARDLAKGRPLSGDLKTIGEVSLAFPKATQALKEAPKAVSPWDVAAAGAAAITSGNPLLLGSVAARPMARSAVLSDVWQRSAVRTAGNAAKNIPAGLGASAVGAAGRTNFDQGAEQLPPTDETQQPAPDLGPQSSWGGDPAAPVLAQAIPVPKTRAEQIADERARLEQMRASAMASIGTAKTVDEAIAAATTAINVPMKGAIESSPVPPPAPPEPIATTAGFPMPQMQEPTPQSVAQAPAPDWRNDERLIPVSQREATRVDMAALDAAADPSDPQRAARNFKHGHTLLAGMDISIANAAGSMRRGVDEQGAPWEREAAAHIGKIRGSRGKGGVPLTAIVAPGTPENFRGPIFVVDQIKADGKFDENKVIVGAQTEEEAADLYLAQFPAGWDRLGAVTRLPAAAFHTWLKHGAKRKPLGDIDGGQGGQGDGADDEPMFAAARQPTGELIVRGDPDAIVQRLADAGVSNFLRLSSGVVVGKSSAESAESLFAA